MHRLFQVDVAALWRAFNCMAGSAGGGIAGMVANYAILFGAGHPFFMIDMVESHRIHGCAIRIGLFTDGKDHDCRRGPAVSGRQTISP